jgi:long-chain acyl-CoA synthetase
MKGYYGDPRETEAAFSHGWLRTGDLGYLDREGYLFITGRKKEVIVLSSGINIFPEEAEEGYLKTPLIKEIGVLGVEGKGKTEGLFGIVVPNLNYATEASVGSIRQALKEEIGRLSTGLPSHMRLKGFAIYKEPLPRTPLGKLKRYMLKELLSVTAKDREEPEEEKRLFEDPVGRKISDCLLTLLDNKRPIRLSDHLELDLGLDSLTRVEFIASLEEAFSLRLPDDFLSGAQTVRDVVSAIKRTNTGSGQRPQVPKWKEMVTVDPSREEKRTIALERNKLEQSFLLLMAGVCRFLFRFFFKLEVKGIENLPRSPFIIASNHLSNIDGFVVAAAVRSDILRVLYFLGYRPYFMGLVRSFFARMAHVIPIDPEGHMLKALRIASYILRNGGSLCIFPEGRRSYDGTIGEFKKGISILARNHRVPVVPTRIEGTFRVLPRGAIFPKFGPVKIIFGQPVRTPDLMEVSIIKEAVDEDRSFAEFLRERVGSLK